jgi:glycine cleavage system regulatory protein/virulence-associated protein VapD
VYSESGDKFQWNGSAYVKVEEVSNPGVTDFARSGILAAMTYYMGSGLTDFLSSSTLTTASGQTIAGPGLSSSLATGASSGISNAAMQLVATGNVDFGEALESAITAGLGSEALRQIQESGVLDQIVETVGQYTERQDWISLEDGTLFKIVNEYDANGNSLSRVLMPNGGTLSLENFLQFASEGTFGSPVLFDAVGLPVFFFREGLQTPEFIDRLIEAASDAYYENGSTFNQIVNFLSGGSSSGGGSSSYGAVLTGDLNSTSDNATLLNILRGALENTTDPETRADLERQIEAYEREVEDEEEVNVNEDDTVEDADSVLADTTADNAPGITEEMFQDVVDQVRADNQVETQEIIDAINALGVADLPTLAQIQEAFPELNDVSLEQINDTVSTLLSNAGLLTSEQFTEAMTGVLTPEQLATALANLPYGDAEDFIDAVANAGYATPENIAQLLNERDLMSNEDFSTYMEQFREDVVGDVGTLLDEALEDFPFPETFTEAQIEQLRETIVIPEGASMEQIQEALNRLADQIPEEAPTLEEMSTLFNNALDGLNIASPEDVRDALAEFNFSDAQIAQIINALPEGLNKDDLSTALEGVVVGEDLDAAVTTITDLIGDLKIASTEDIRTLLSEYGFTDAQLQQISQAVNIPESVTLAELRQELDNLPEELTAQEVIDLMLESNIATKSDFQTMLDEAFENFVFPETFTEAQIKQIKDSIVFPSTASMDQIQTALDRLAEQIPEAGPSLDDIQKLFTDTLGGLAIASPQDVRDALSEFEFSEAQINQIINALPENISNSDLATALEGIVVGEDLDAAVTKITEAVSALNIASPEDIRTILSEYGFTDAQLQQIVNALPEGLSLEQVQTSLSSALEGIATGVSLEASTTKIISALGELDIASPQDVRDALAEFNFSEAQIAQIINALPEGLSVADLGTALEGVVVGEDLDAAVTTITDAIGGLDIASPDDVREILANYGFTDAQLEQIAGSITIPASATVAQVRAIVDSIPAGLTAEEVATQLSSQFEGLATGIEGVQSGIDQLAEDLGLSTEGLLTAIAGLGTTTGENLTDLQRNILEGLGEISENLNLDIGDVVTSVTDLEEGLTENITGLSDQLTGVEEAVGGVTAAVNQGIEDLAETLNVQTDDITSAIVTLGSGLGGELTELETSVLSGLTSLANSLGTDVGTVVDSIGGLGTGISENIQGLSDTLTEQLGTGFGSIGGQIESGFGQLGQQLGLATLGLFGLGAKQPTAQQIAAAKPFEFKPFEEKASPRQVQQVVQSGPIKQQPSALQQLNQLLDRQSNTPQKPPRKPGMLA